MQSRKKELDLVAAKIKNCKRCRLYKTRQTAVPGEGIVNADIMFIGMGPGREEDKTGLPFIGRAGKFLDSMLDRFGIDRKRCFITSVVKCYLPGNRPPKQDEIEACRGFLLEQIRIVDPKTIVALGNVAKKVVMEIKTDKKVIYTYHPAAGMRFPKIRDKIFKDFKSLR